MTQLFLPITQKDVSERNWDAPDFVYVFGEAYVDHPSFGHAIISRVLESAGYNVAMLSLPDWKSTKDFMRFGKPKLGFLVSAGVIDSMVNHYTTAKKKRSNDVYAPGGQGGMRPDRATIVYCNRIREAYGNIPIFIGGIEASLRRFSHYDYWDDKVRHSILLDSAATILMYGMGEKVILNCANWLKEGGDMSKLSQIRGICYLSETVAENYHLLPSHKEVSSSKTVYAKAFMKQYQEQDPYSGNPLAQLQEKNQFVLQNPPEFPLSRKELDAVYALAFVKKWHPVYDSLGGVPALEEVSFSIASTRGCFGGCNFCAITFHQGRIVQSRSPQSIIQEAEQLTHHPDFKGYIHDIGGPTANFRHPSCQKQLTHGVCKRKQCLFPEPCPHVEISHKEFLFILKKVRQLPKMKKVFVRSGLRYDYIMADKDHSFLQELCAHHVSGQLKVAPEHVSPQVLYYMGKPKVEVYDAFARRYKRINEKLKKKQYLVPYLMSSHPGSTLHSAIDLALYLKKIGYQPQQVQDFYPTPGTLSTCMFYTGLDPRTMKKVFVPKSAEEKAMQRALLQYKNPRNFPLVRKALQLAGREDLIGYGKNVLVTPAYIPNQTSPMRKKSPLNKKNASSKKRQPAKKRRPS
ncbi:MAG: YgiQ family radical SAM protein [Clostridiales bacterium]|nr:YgiQ family radical SAM protein [Clostridiales bacterium]